jgi:predicted DNA-binding transcriptional regulator AlpA
MQEKIYTPELITLKEAAKVLSVSIGTLDKLRASEPNFPLPFPIGKSLRYDKRALIEWLHKKAASAQRTAGGAA